MTTQLESNAPLMKNEESSSEHRRVATGDPFYVVKEELESKFIELKAECDKLDLLSSGSNQDAKCWTDASTQLRACQLQLRILNQSLNRVESKPMQFKHISAEELVQRREFVTQTEDQVQLLTEKLTSMDSQKKLPRLQSAQNSGSKRSEKETFQQEQQRQQALLQEQDENIVELGTAVTHLGHVAGNINGEIELQNKMLDDMGDDLDDATERMQFVMGKMSKLLKTKDKCQLGSILILTFILIVMIFLVMYT